MKRERENKVIFRNVVWLFRFIINGKCNNRKINEFKFRNF